MSRGGWLDEAIWVANTNNEGDQVYAKGIAVEALRYTYLPISISHEEKKPQSTRV